jgi:hypothetical protein
MKINIKSLFMLLMSSMILFGNVNIVNANDDFPTKQELERMNATSRNSLLNYLSEREALKASQNPEEFNKNVEDISVMRAAGAMTGEMAKFYMAVAFLEYSRCLKSGDATACTQFIESLKDPIGHIGFALFMKANHMTIDLAQVISRGKINPGMVSYLGLAGGMLAQTVFQDMYYHPLTQELLANSSNKDPELRKKNRKIILNKMWKSVISNSGSYLIEKIPHVAGLLGAAYLSHKTMALTGYTSSKLGNVLARFKPTSGTGKMLITFGENMAASKSVSVTSSKIVLRWADAAIATKRFKKGARLLRLNPYVALAGYAIDTVVFLMWAPIVEDFLVKKWDQSKSKKEIIKNNRSLNDSIVNGDSPEVILKKAKAFSTAFDQYRETIMHKANNTKMRHLMEINKIDKSLHRLVMYYTWLVSGADLDDPLYQANENSWHEDFIVHQINERTDHIEHLFCAQSAEDSVLRKISYHGIPVPGSHSFEYNYDDNRSYYENTMANMTSHRPTGIVFKKPRILNYYGTCDRDIRTVEGDDVNMFTHGTYEDVICPVNSEDGMENIKIKKTTMPRLHCQLTLNWYRSQILKTQQYNGRDIKEELLMGFDSNISVMMQKAWGQRDLMIMNFEKAVRSELIEGLTGLDVEIDEDNGKARIYGTSYDYDGANPLGFIPHLRYELGIWLEYLDGASSEQESVYQGMIKITQAKIKTARETLEFIKKPYKKRVREVDTDMFEEVEPGEWQLIIRTLREYIVN